MKKRILTLLLLCMLFSSLLVTPAFAKDIAQNTNSQGNKYSSDWKYWSQGATQYVGSKMQKGCRVVAQAKLLVEAGIASSDPTVFNPDNYIVWAHSHGYFGNKNQSFKTNIAEQEPVGTAPVGFASSNGRVLNYKGQYYFKDIENIASQNETIMNYLNQGYYIIVGSNSHHAYVLRQNSLEAGTPIISNSQSDCSYRDKLVISYTNYRNKEQKAPFAYYRLYTVENAAPVPQQTSCTNHVKGQYLWPEDAHPHYQYYTCANCGAKFTDGSTTTMSKCSQCNGNTPKREETTVTLTYSEIGYVNCPGKSLVINSKPAKDNKIISVPHGEQITIYPDKAVGNWAFVEYNGVQGYSYKSYISKTPTVTVCTSHVKGEFQWFEAAHPHYNYYKCANCGELFTDGTTAYHSTCTECNIPVVVQPEPQPQPQPEPQPEQPAQQPPLNTPQVSLGSSSIKEGDSLYVSWTSSGEGAEYEITWSGTGGAGSSLNIHNTYDTIDGRYFNTAGDYKLKVSAYRDNEKVESGYVYFTVQPRENVRYGIVTGTDGKNLAINDGPASSANGSNKVGRIPPGGQMKVYPDRTSGNWYWVDYNGIQGYAYKKYITLQ